MSENFLESVYGDTKGWVSIATRSESGAIDSERWLEYPSQLQFMNKYVALRKDEDVYYSTGVFSEPARSKDDVQAMSQIAYADADTCHPDNFRLIPTWIVETSPGHWHCEWVLDRPYPASETSEASRRIYNAHAGQGCDRGWIQTKLLRVPGTSNTKRETSEPVTGTFTGQTYTLAQINEAYADTPVTPELHIANSKAPKPVSEERFHELETMLDNAGLTDLYMKRPEEGQSWSERMFRLQLDLFRLDMTAQEVFSLMLEAPVNKYNPDNAGQLTQQGVPIPRRNNPHEVLWKDVLKAEAEFKATEHVERDSEPIKKGERASFLSLDERQLLTDNPTYIDEYVDWAKAKSPDSAESYHRSLAYILLSSCFSDRVFMRTIWGTTFPNLWLLLIGPTTRTRKSTAVGFYTKILSVIEDVEGLMINIGSDATAEALTTVLGTRDGQISAIITDEVQSLFAEAGTKNYRVGTFDTYTKLYDGRVDVVLRNTKGSGNRNRATTRFLFLGTGILSGVAKALKRENFASGFLPRFTWAVADAPPYKPGSEAMQQPDREAGSQYDFSFNERAKDLVERRSHWDPANPSYLMFEQDALDRLNQFREDMENIVNARFDSELLSAVVDRLHTSVAKAATLLAAYYKTEDIHILHTLAAIQQGEEWFNNAIRMFGEVSSSDFGRLCDDVEKFIAQGPSGQRLESAIYKNFTFKPAEFTEVITGLTKQGRIRYVQGQRQRLEVMM